MSATNSADDTRLQGEAAIIAYLAPLAAGYPGAFGLKDDCAAITPTPGHDLVVKTDPVAEGIHFLPDDDPADIGWRALAVNVSDLAAKGAVPRAYLMALSFPEAPTRGWMERFARGLSAAQTAFGVHLVGGDTDKRPGPITVSITVLGEVPHGRMVRRDTARAGDIVYVTGDLGAGALGLALGRDPSLAERWGLGHEAAAVAIERFRRPQPRLALRDALLAHAGASMDLSDGLAKDLGRMCRASGCGARIELARIPLGDAARAATAFDRAHWLDVIAAGDDYEVLVAVRPDRARMFEAEAIRGGSMAARAFTVTRIGEMTPQPGVTFIDADGADFPIDRTGWDHF